MQLAFRRTAADGANALKRAAAWLTRERLVSEYCHGGIVIDGLLYHVNADDNLHVTPFSPEKWELFDVGDQYDPYALILFRQMEGTKYDWFSLLAFAIPHKSFRDSSRLYCFEWMALAMGMPLDGRVTPEKLLAEALRRGKLERVYPPTEYPEGVIASVPVSS